MGKMRAKFHCDSVNPETGMARMTAVYAAEGNEENNQFSEATPFGSLEMQVSNPGAKDFLKQGKEYYLDFSEVILVEEEGGFDKIFKINKQPIHGQVYLTGSLSDTVRLK